MKAHPIYFAAHPTKRYFKYEKKPKLKYNSVYRKTNRMILYLDHPKNLTQKVTIVQLIYIVLVIILVNVKSQARSL